MLITSVLSADKPSERRLSASAAWHLTAVNYNSNHSTIITSVLSADKPSERRLSVSAAWHLTAINFNSNNSTIITSASAAWHLTAVNYNSNNSTIITSVLSADKPSERRLSASAAWHPPPSTTTVTIPLSSPAYCQQTSQVNAGSQCRQPDTSPPSTTTIPLSSPAATLTINVSVMSIERVICPFKNYSKKK